MIPSPPVHMPAWPRYFGDNVFTSQHTESVSSQQSTSEPVRLGSAGELSSEYYDMHTSPETSEESAAIEGNYYVYTRKARRRSEPSGRKPPRRSTSSPAPDGRPRMERRPSRAQDRSRPPSVAPPSSRTSSIGGEFGPKYLPYNLSRYVVVLCHRRRSVGWMGLKTDGTSSGCKHSRTGKLSVQRRWVQLEEGTYYKKQGTVHNSCP